ncbi:MAG TPA: preprotein translocase subunit SecE [Bacteroidia bacterium]|jgi:preprotein translocase subunit SecE|nr:preprotein translocase subunit SecE [Bacteroidia bacterium]HNO71326.1 preprotein translocase subunit SecE [Bacteroidia bacterium]
MNKVQAYFNDTYSELVTKVSWPTWKELQASAVIVMVATLLTSLLVYGMDVAFKFIMEMIYNFFA